MSVPRLVLLAIGLPLLTGACGAPVAVTAVSYGADSVSMADSGKSTSDHFISMVSRKDCAMWRVLRGRSVCTERKDGRDPYEVNYDEANRLPSEDGVSYAPPLHAASDAPASSWTAAAYAKPASAAERPQTAAPAAPAEPDPAVAETPAAAPPAVAKPGKPGKSAKKKPKAGPAHAKAVKKPSPGQVASAP
ncbi:MAG TPA: hypothetical protein VLA02_10515 [Reyranella sp.]|nr:hypothetical protein [Reyranella sp.]